jgi:hypothetical protein
VREFDLLILTAVSLGPVYGYGVLLRIKETSATSSRSSRGRFILR